MKKNEQSYIEQINRFFADNEVLFNTENSDFVLRFLISENEVSKIFSIPKNTLRASRNSGKLWGVEAPLFYKFGNKTVRYKASDILDWLDQFEKYKNSAQVNY